MAKDFSGTARNIIPSGQYGGVPTAKADQQAKMYDALTPLFDKVTNAALNTDFKSEKLGKAGTPGPTTVEKVPRKGVRIVRDEFNVPHVYGKTHDDVVWASGWILQEDRGLLLGQARYPARLAALDAPGINAINLIVGLKSVQTTPVVDQMIESEQTGLLKKQGKRGLALLHDHRHLCEGREREADVRQVDGQAVHARGHLRRQCGRRSAVRPRRR